jgi:hypothetical protein
MGIPVSVLLRYPGVRYRARAEIWESDMGVSQLGYLVLDVSDIDAWRDLAVSIIGAEERRDEGADVVRLRFDEHHHRITLRPTNADSLAAIGWEAGLFASPEYQSSCILSSSPTPLIWTPRPT